MTSQFDFFCYRAHHDHDHCKRQSQSGLCKSADFRPSLSHSFFPLSQLISCLQLANKLLNTSTTGGQPCRVKERQILCKFDSNDRCSLNQNKGILGLEKVAIRAVTLK